MRVRVLPASAISTQWYAKSAWSGNFRRQAGSARSRGKAGRVQEGDCRHEASAALAVAEIATEISIPRI
jgi:hypothetical protein